MFRAVAPLALALAACAEGTSPADAERLCQTSCARFAECGLTAGLSEDACVEACTEQSATPDCETTRAENDACRDAYATATCDELASGSPAACAVTCDDDGADTGGSTDSGNPTDTGGSTDTGTALTEACADLQACCDQMDAANAEICQLVVDANFTAGCTPAREQYIADGLCTE